MYGGHIGRPYTEEKRARKPLIAANASSKIYMNVANNLEAYRKRYSRMQFYAKSDRCELPFGKKGKTIDCEGFRRVSTLQSRRAPRGD